MTALREQMFRVGLLKIAAPDFLARNLRRNRKYGDPGAMTIVEAVNQMKIAGTTTAGTHGQLPGQLRLGAGRERRRFFMPDGNPLQIFPGRIESVTPFSESPTSP
jgi:hypothetical protein